MRKRVLAVALGIPGVIYALLWNLAQISPQEAKRNLGAWAPTFLASLWALAAVLTLTAVGYAWLFQTQIQTTWRQFGIRSPIYSKEAQQSVLQNARITAQAEALKQIARVETDATLTVELAHIEVENERRGYRLLQEEATGLASELTVERDKANRCFERQQYGQELAASVVLDTHEYAAMRATLQRLKPSLDRLREQSDKIWNAMLAMAAGVEPESPLAWLLWCFKNYPAVYGPATVRDFLTAVVSVQI